MRKTLWYAAALAAGLLVVPAARAEDKDEAKDKGKKGQEIAWAKTFAAAKDQAKKDNKLIMVDFYTDWCGWCKKLDADTYTDPAVVRLARQIVSVKLDAEDKGEGQEAAGRYKVRGYPTILFLDPGAIEEKSGGVIGKIGGYLPPEPFSAQVRQVIDGFKDFPKLQARLKESPDDPEALGKLAALSHMRGDDDRAAELLQAAEKADPHNASGHLTKAYNAVADHHQEAQEFDKAIPLFRTAAETGKDPSDIAYARSSIAVCYLSQNQLDKAIPELEAVAKIPGVSKGDREQAEQLLARIKQFQERQKARKPDGKDL